MVLPSNDRLSADTASSGDENRPRCINCTKRGAACQYSSFKSVLLHQSSSLEVDEGLSVSQSPSSATIQRGGDSGEIHIPQPLRSPSDAFAKNAPVFPDNDLGRRGTSPELPPTSGALHDRPSTGHRSDQFADVDGTTTHTVFHPLPSIVWNTNAVETANPASVTGNTSERPFNRSRPHSTSTITGEPGPNDFPEGPGSSSSLRSLANGSILRITRQDDIQLLSHFRYHIAPWLDVNDSRAFFGVDLLSTARDSPIIMATVLRLAAIHRSIISSSDGTDHTRIQHQEYMPDLEILLPRETPSVQRKCRLLLKVGKLFSLAPRRWNELASESDEFLRTTFVDVVEEPLFLWCFRIGM